MRPYRLATHALLAALTTVTAPAGAFVVAVSFSSDTEPFPSNLYRIDTTTGTATLVGSTGFEDLNSLDFDPASGFLYSAGDVLGAPDGTNDTLLRINPLTGAATAVAPITLPGGGIVDIRSLAFAPDGKLYAENAPHGGSDVSAHDLWTINPVTGAGTLVGRLLAGTLGVASQSLDFGPDGNLYGWDFTTLDGSPAFGLIRINPATSAVTDVNPATTSESFNTLQSLLFASDGKLYSVTGGTLRVVNPASDSTTVIGSAPIPGLRGLAEVPEPRTTVIALGLSLFRRRATARV